MSLWSGLRALFGESKPKKAIARAKPKKAARDPAARAALLNEAMAAHRTGRTHVREEVERQLNELRAGVPKPGREPASGPPSKALQKLMTSDLKRVLTLVGMRQKMLDEEPSADKTTRPESRPSPRR